MRDNEGISLITLVVMVVVMIILASIAINVGTDSYENALESKAAAERQQVIAAVSGRFGDYQRNNTASPLVGLVIPEASLATPDDIETYCIQMFKNEYGKLITDDEINNSTQQNLIKKFVSDNFEDMEYTRILIYSDLTELGIEKTNLNALYLVNYYSSDVVGPIN